jgi:hypothetical protein
MSMAHTPSHAGLPRSLLSWIAARLTRTWFVAGDRLDQRSLSDHLRRDMGFLDGRGVAGGLRWHIQAEFPFDGSRDHWTKEC